jgi:hypothetical protein
MPATATRVPRFDPVAVEELERRLREAYLRLQEMDRLRARLADAEGRVTYFQGELDARYRELATLAEMLARGESSRERRGTSWMRLAARLGGALRRWRESLRLRQARRRIRASGLFDARWYMARYPDVAASGMDPLEHFLVFGASEGRLLGPAFAADDSRKGRVR